MITNLQQRKTKGFTLLELVVVITLISVLALVALDRIWVLRVQAERASVSAVVGNIRSALGLEVAKYALANELFKIVALEGTNPVVLLAQAPGEYIGEITDEAAIREKGIWYFNSQSKVLVYRVQFDEYFTSDLKAPFVRFQVKLLYGDKNNNGKFDFNTDTIDGLDLVSMDTYRWDIP
ncbi:MAG: type II secretion system GspH family protein [Gammaproteobacteria bacterium]|nr:type II secretion system GspH family protein [Gammaproteobacteria bacterium]